MAKRYTEDELNKIEEQFGALVLDQNYSYLVVESSVAQRKTFVNALSAAGCENILEAKDGMDAMIVLKKVEGNVVVIVAQNLPSMTGLQFLQQLRKDERFKSSPAVFLSNDGKKETIVAAVKLGAKAFLKKPFPPESLPAKLSELGYL